MELIRQVREAVGPGMKIMIDANHGYDAAEAIKVGRAATNYDIDWFEEPVLPELARSYHEVRSRQPIPVAGGETWQTRWGMKSPVEKRLIDILQPDVCGVGGFSEFKRVVEHAQMHGVRVVPHVWGKVYRLPRACKRSHPSHSRHPGGSRSNQFLNLIAPKTHFGRPY